MNALRSIEGVYLREAAILAPYTTYKIGGAARLLVEVTTRAALPRVLATLEDEGVRWLVLGNGSNVLVADRGFDGAVIVLADEHSEIRLTRNAFGADGHRVVAGAAASMTKLLRLAKDELLSNLWFLGGIPGVVGGAVKMNAGTRYGELSQVLVAAELASASGYRWEPNDRLGLSYRRSELPAGTVVAAAELRVGDADPSMRTKLDEVLAYRKATQPLHLPSCGSVFANPPGDAAGRLIEAAGLKGTQIGGAQISEQHANWIVNRGDATANDVRDLIERIRQTVLSHSGVALHPEVQLVGDWPDLSTEAGA